MASRSTLVTHNSLFLGIPTECRVRIYQYVFSGVRLNLDEMTGNTSQLKLSQTKDNSNAIARMIELIASINDSKTAILFSCRQIFGEGPEFLAKAATLVVKRVIGRQDPTAIIPSSLLNRVSNLEIDFHAFVHVNRKSMGALKNVTVFKGVEGIEGSDAGYHVLLCKNCGGENGELLIEDVMYGTHSWQWFMKQIAHLSKEEGWKVVMSARLEYTMKPAYHYLEAIVDLESFEATRKQGVWNGKVLEIDDWLECFHSYKADTNALDPCRTWVL